MIIEEHKSNKSKIWNGAFISIFIANAMMNMGQQMVNSLIAKYADFLGGKSTLIGLLSGIFAATALGFKVFSGPAIDSFNRKIILMIAMSVLAISYLGYGISKTLPMLFIFRLVEGAARAFTATCCLAIAADTLPADQLNSGIGIYSLAQASCQAIGPTIGLTLYRYIGYNTLFIIAAVCLGGGVILASKIKLPRVERKKFQINLSSIVAKETIIPATLLFLLSGTFFTINSFLAIYATNMGVLNIGFFFTVYAGTMIISRPLIGRLSDQYGLVKVAIPSLCCFAISFLVISISKSLPMFLIAAFISAFGYGAVQPAIQALCMKCVPITRRGAASSTAYIGNDLGNLVGPVVAGYIAEQFGYQLMWEIMITPICMAIVLIMLFRKKFNYIEKEFKLRNLN